MDINSMQINFHLQTPKQHITHTHAHTQKGVRVGVKISMRLIRFGLDVGTRSIFEVQKERDFSAERKDIKQRTKKGRNKKKEADSVANHLNRSGFSSGI